MTPSLIPRAARSGSFTITALSAAEVRKPVSMITAGVVGATACS